VRKRWLGVGREYEVRRVDVKEEDERIDGRLCGLAGGAGSEGWRPGRIVTNPASDLSRYLPARAPPNNLGTPPVSPTQLACRHPNKTLTRAKNLLASQSNGLVSSPACHHRSNCSTGTTLELLISTFCMSIFINW
jgi:hypothetical protein